MDKRRIPGVNKSFYKLKKYHLDCWKMHVFLIKPCWLPCKPSRVPLMCAQQLWIIYLFVFQDDFQKLPDCFGEHMVNFDMIWSGFARVTGTGAGYAAEELANTQISERNVEKVEMCMKLLWKWVVNKIWRKLSEGRGREGNVTFSTQKKTLNQCWENKWQGH